MSMRIDTDNNFDFYPRSPCGERLWPGLLARPFFIISIHALLAESDIGPLIFNVQPRNFYPRSPCGERLAIGLSTKSISNFYPRSPCGERLIMEATKVENQYFYPRSPCGERPHIRSTSHGRRGISIHALLAESDTSRLHKNICGWGFLSTLSLRRATHLIHARNFGHFISIHALLAESDHYFCGAAL